MNRKTSIVGFVAILGLACAVITAPAQKQGEEFDAIAALNARTML